MNRKIRNKIGSALVDYVVPAAVIGVVVGLALYHISASGMLKNFVTNTANVTMDQTTNKATISKNTAPAPLADESKVIKTSTSGVATQCSGGLCNIDFGNYTLTGIPENFEEYTENSGDSGGTGQIASMLAQIAAQLEAEGDFAGAAEYRKLSNLGHFMADVQQKSEDYSNACLGNVHGVACLRSKLDDPNTGLTVNPDIADLLAGFNTNKPIKSILIGTNLGKVRNLMKTGTSAATLNSGYEPAYSFIKLYDDIMANPKFSPEMKKVTKELYVTAANISFHHDGRVTGIDMNGAESKRTKFNPITGAAIGEVDYTLSSDVPSTDFVLNKVLHPPASVGSDADAQLICTVGQNKDNGQNCK